MALTKDQKQAQLKDLTKKFEEAQSVMFAHYIGLNVLEVSELRNKLREEEAQMKVAKKTLLKLAAEQAKMPALEDDALDGPVGCIFSFGDALSGAQVAFKFGKDHKQVELIGGIFEGKLLTKEEALELAKMPSKEVLLATFASMLRSPLYSFAGMCNSPLSGFARALAEVAKKKEAEARRLAEEQRIRDEEARKVREEELRQQMAAEEQRLATLREKYEALIRAKVQRNWRRPPGVVDGATCEVLVNQLPGGLVNTVNVAACSGGDEILQRSVKTAVLKAEPLPAAPDPSVFDRDIKFTFIVTR